MSNKQKDTQHIKLYAGPEHACGYLDKKNSISVFADPSLDFNNSLYSELSRIGFRRSGDHIYRPQCPDCSACWTYRVLSDEFKLKSGHKRILKANKELTVELSAPIASAEDYELYEEYICERHADGEMFPPSFQQYEEFLFSKWCDSMLLKAVDPSGKVHAVMALDILDDGLSAVYSFFSPTSEYKSLGVYLILQTIELCRVHQLPFCYLGYYIENCDKMNYKKNYQPAEVFANNRWQKLINTQ